MISPGELCRVVPCHDVESWEVLWSPPASPVRGAAVIAPPPQFQDSSPQHTVTTTAATSEETRCNKVINGHVVDISPSIYVIELYAAKLVERLLVESIEASLKVTWSIPCSQVCHMSGSLSRRQSAGGRWSGLRLCWTPELQPYSPCHGRLSSSHTSLSVPADDSSMISPALSHDALLEVYAEPCESDSYAVPVDVVRQPSMGPARGSRHTPIGCRPHRSRQPRSSSAGCNPEPIHLTLQEVRQYLHTLYSSGSEASETLERLSKAFSNEETNNNQPHCYKKQMKTTPVKCKTKPKESVKKSQAPKMSFPNFKQTLCNMFRLKKIPTPTQCLGRRDAPPLTDEVGARLSGQMDPPSPITKPPFMRRALPPLPSADSTPTPQPPPHPPERPSDMAIDFAASIQKVKDYGWYWGPISGEAAERILLDEPDGSFIVRDSSDDYYIFSLTFKLNSIVRHVRIEHDQGNFSFGNTTRFKSHTIVDFIESAVEHSRSGRYLFFLHRRPVLGPMRVQLLHPVSRFKQVQSLQHMCRFVILKHVRRDLIPLLPLPKSVLDYLSTKHYYTENLLDETGVESPTS